VAGSGAVSGAPGQGTDRVVSWVLIVVVIAIVVVLALLLQRRRRTGGVIAAPPRSRHTRQSGRDEP
jgi:hypothetical protein